MKRPSEVQITKDNHDEQDDSDNKKHSDTFDRAAPEIVAKRRIVKARRTIHPSTTENNEKSAPNPFAKLTTPAVSTPPNPLIQTTENTDQSKQKEPEKDKSDTPEENKNIQHETTTTVNEKPTESSTKVPTKTDSDPTEDNTANGTKENNANKTTTPNPKINIDGEEKTKATETKPVVDEKEKDTGEKDKQPTETNGDKPTEKETEQKSEEQPKEETKDEPAAKPAEPEKKPMFVFGGTAPTLTFASATKTVSNDPFNLKKEGPIIAPPVVEKKPEYQEADVKTGEEDEDELHRFRAKLYTLENSEKGQRWKERGVGQVKLNKHKSTSKVRLVMRTEATLKVVLNTPVFKEMKLDRATERSIRFQGLDTVDVEKGEEKGRFTVFLLRLSTRDAASELIDAIEKLKPKE